MSRLTLGIDIGGTFIKYALVDEEFNIVEKWKVPTVRFDSKDEFYDYICSNIESLDIDIRGIALNRKEELLTNQNFEQFVNEETDTTIYSFNKIITLLTNCNPNTIEMLGLKPEHYLYLSPIG